MTLKYIDNDLNIEDYTAEERASDLFPENEKLFSLKDRPSGMDTAVRRFYRSSHTLTREDIEDAFMDAVMKAYENNKKKNAGQILGHTKVLKFRKSATNLGKIQSGKKPVKGLRLHIINEYSPEGDNLIEKMGYDYKSDLIIGTN